MENQPKGMLNASNGELREDIPRIHIENESQQQEEGGDALWLDFQSGADAEGIRSDGMETYVISPVTEQDLFSDKYLNCTGVIGIGRDRDSGREVTAGVFSSHSIYLITCKQKKYLTQTYSLSF